MSCAGHSSCRQRDRHSSLKIICQNVTQSDAKRQKLRFLGATIKNSPNVDLSNGGFYMAPQHEGTYRFSVDTNGYDGEMSPDAAGITVCLFAYSHLSFRYADDQVFANHFHRLREFAMDHAEALAIFAAID